MRVLFVVPPYRSCDSAYSYARLFPMPMAPVLLASILKRGGHTVEVQDFLVPKQVHKTPAPAAFAGKGNPPYQHFGRRLEDCLDWLRANHKRFDVVCLCSQQCNLWETVEVLAHEIRRLDKPLVMGGSYCTTAPSEAQSKFEPDVLVVGEGEAVVEEVVERAADGERGIVVPGKPVVLSDSPLPDWSLVDLGLYPPCGSRMRGVLFVSRGCPWECQFCSVFTMVGRGHRRQTRERIAAEIENLCRYGVRHICFLDDNLFVNEKAVDDVLGAIDDVEKANPGFLKSSRFYCEEGLEVRMAAKPGILQRVVTHNFVDVAFGVESLNRVAMCSQKKPYKPEQLAQVAAECKRLGATARAFYIIGFPEDTLASVARDMVAFARLGLGVRSNNLKFYPGTPMTLAQQERGRLQDFDWRFSSWYTPKVGELEWKQIRHLKSLLDAVGFAASELGIDPFGSPPTEIRRALQDNGYRLRLLMDSVEVVGNLFRPARIALLAEILCCRHVGSAGAVAKQINKQAIRATATKEPKDDCQAALLAAMRGEQFIGHKRLGFFD